MKYIDELDIQNKRVLLRVDFNVSLNPDHSIANDERIRQTIPTITYLSKNNNQLIIVSHLGRPEKRDPEFSLRKVAADLASLLPRNSVVLVDDFLTQKDIFLTQQASQILLLENIRFYPGEEENDPDFSHELALLADIYVNDAFSVSHRIAASIVGVTSFLPSYGGLLLKKEVSSLSRLTNNPEKPFVAILGGSKISTKIKLISKLTTLADCVILGGGLANTFLLAQEIRVGKSLCEETELDEAKRLLQIARDNNTDILLPTDVIVADSETADTGNVVSIRSIPPEAIILDIGPDTQAHFESVILEAKTIVWNGPVGYFENPAFRRGTDFIYYAISQNTQAFSVIGGGETLAAISKKEYLEKISHISTGGGAMLEFIENGTLPGIEALERAKTS